MIDANNATIMVNNVTASRRVCPVSTDLYTSRFGFALQQPESCFDQYGCAQWKDRLVNVEDRCMVASIPVVVFCAQIEHGPRRKLGHVAKILRAHASFPGFQPVFADHI